MNGGGGGSGREVFNRSVFTIIFGTVVKPIIINGRVGLASVVGFNEILELATE
jgi:hypothetical protein